MIITTRKYSAEEIKEILQIRAREEKVKLSEEALETLTKIGEETSLRYAAQMLTPAQIIAKRKGRDTVTAEDVKEIRTLFADVKQSSEYLKKYEAEMLK
ncbi:MAG: hypothetical protein NDF54_03190 [archaeon GB-1867-035]|nr:hypothetical protein [Candidatus Culexmicrobium profundum]